MTTLYDLLPRRAERAANVDYQPWEGDGEGEPGALRALVAACERVSSAPMGSGNATFNQAVFSIAGLVAAGQLDAEHAERSLKAAADQMNYPRDEAAAVFAAAWDAGFAAPWSNVPTGWHEAPALKKEDQQPEPQLVLTPAPKLPALPDWAAERIPCPVHCWPEPVQRLIVMGAPATACTVEYLAAATLPAMASAVGGLTTLNLASGWRIPAVFYVALVGPPGAAKTPAIERAIAPIRRVQDNGFVDTDGGDVGMRFLVDDTTTEKLGVLLKKHPRGLLMPVDELKAFFGGHGQYKEGGGRDRQFYLSIWSGISQIVDRIKRDTEYIRNPTLSVLGGIQPDVFAGIVIGVEDGMWPRFLLAYSDAPQPGTKRWHRPSPDFPKVLQDYDDLWNDVRDANTFERQLPLSDDGMAAWVEWYDQHYNSTPPPPLVTTWTKVETHVARVALVLACWELAQEVTGDHIRRAAEIVRWFLSEAMHISRVVELYDPNEEKHVRNRQRLAEYLLKWQADHQGKLPSRTWVMQNGPRGSRTARSLDVYLAELRMELE